MIDPKYVAYWYHLLREYNAYQPVDYGSGFRHWFRKTHRCYFDWNLEEVIYDDDNAFDELADKVSKFEMWKALYD